MTILKSEPRACLACEQPLDRQLELRWRDLPPAERPQEGDGVVCLHCGCAMVFDASLRFRYPTITESEVMRDDKRMQHLIKTAKEKRQ
jgi:hypothetical protein